MLLPYAGNEDAFPLLKEAFVYTLAASIVLITVLLLLGMLAMIGTPRQAGVVSRSFTHAGIVDRYGFPPVLVACRYEKQGGIRTLTLYSRGISRETYMQKKHDIEDILNCHYVEEPKYGGKNNGNYIVLTVGPGAVEIGRTEPLYDDEL